MPSSTPSAAPFRHVTIADHKDVVQRRSGRCRSHRFCHGISLAVAPCRTLQVLFAHAVLDPATPMSDENLYLSKYRAFFKARDQAQGYEFQHAPTGNVPPPKV